MADYVGTVENVIHYAETLVIGWSYRAIHIEARTNPGRVPLILTEDLGKVQSLDAAVDLVTTIVDRERRLLELSQASTPPTTRTLDC